MNPKIGKQSRSVPLCAKLGVTLRLKKPQRKQSLAQSGTEGESRLILVYLVLF